MVYNSIKKLFLSTLVFMLIFMNTSTIFARITLQYDGNMHEYTESPFEFYVDGKQLTDLPVEPVRINGRFYVPVRAFFEQLGADVQWFPESQQILILNNADMVLMQIDSLEYSVNAQILTLNEGESPKLVNYQGDSSASTMVPVRMVSEGLGYNVIYDGDNKKISINSSNVSPIPEEPPVETPIVEEPTTEIPTTEIPTTEIPTTDIPKVEIPVIETPVVDNSTVKSFIMPINKSQTSLSSITANETTLSKVVYNEGTIENNYTETIVLSTTSEISKVSELVLPDGRLVLDFSNTIFGISKPNLTVSDSSSFTYTNGSQFEKTPTPTARFVLNLKSGIEYTLTLSEDRKSLTITFLKGYLTNFNFNDDILSIIGTKSFSANTTVLLDPLRIVVDIPNMILDTTSINADYNLPVVSNVVSNIRISQFTPTSVRFVLDMSNDFSYTTGYLDKGIKLTVSPMDDLPAYYSYSQNRFIIKKSKLSNSITLDSISKVEDVTYKAKEYKFTFNATIPELGSSFEKNVSSGIFDYYKFTNNDNSSQLNITLNTARTFVITEDTDNIYLTPKIPGDVYDKVVVIDPGHGGTDVGTTLNGLHEKDIVLDIGKQIKTILEESGENIKVYISRNIDEIIPLYDIPEFTDQVNPDIFVSVHVNSASPNTVANGTETHYYTDQSLTLANIIQKNMLATMGTNDRKVKKTSFVVTRESQVPSVLAETAFISNPSDNTKLRSAEWRTKTANGIANGIIEALSVYN